MNSAMKKATIALLPLLAVLLSGYSFRGAFIAIPRPGPA
jgi:hypothetical protein